MSSLARPAQDAVEAAFGVNSHIHIQHIPHAVAWVTDGVGDVLAIAGGATPDAAWRALIVQCYRPDHRPTTSEVAVVLGITASGVRYNVMTGTLVPEQLGRGGEEARFRVADVWERVRERVGEQGLTK